MRLLRAVLGVVMAVGLVVSVGTSPPGVSAAGVVTVADGSSAYPCTWGGLDAAIGDVDAGGTVGFACSSGTIAFTSASNFGARISIDKAVTIDGSNASGGDMVLDALADDGTYNTFFVVQSGGDLTLLEMTMRNGYGGNGGAIEVQPGGALTATGVMFRDNYATWGGAVWSSGSSATFDRCTFVNNSGSHGGALNGGELRVDRSSFVGNSAGLQGGAISAFYALEISRSSFVDNSANGSGGAIAIQNGTTTEIVSSTFSGNRSAAGGSTIHIWSASSQPLIAWSTIVQPAGTSSALVSGQPVMLVGMIFGGDGVHCILTGSTDSYSLSNDTSCGLDGPGSHEGVDDLGLGSLSTAQVDGVSQRFHPLLSDSPAVDAAPGDCDLDTDQLGNARPNNGYCDIGAIESSFAAEMLCVHSWTGQVLLGASCGRGDSVVNQRVEVPFSLCVNAWNGSARYGSACSRSERLVTVTGDWSVGVCVNGWNGAMRVSASCSRSEERIWM